MDERRETGDRLKSPVPGPRSPVRFAALDLGSLTVRLAIAEKTAAGLKILLHRREITGLGQGLAQTGKLAAEGMDRTFQALQGFCRVMADYRVEQYRAVATHAVRAAANGREFLARLRAELDLAAEVLAPEEEARLSLQGVLSALAPEYLQGPVLVFDVGGGSSEFALVRPFGAPKFASLPLGVLTLTQARPLGDPPEPETVAALRAEIAEKLRRFQEDTFPPDLRDSLRLVGTAGAVTTLAAMHLRLTEYDPQKVNNLVMTKEQVEQLARSICRLPEAERARLPGIEPAKAPVMVAGALIILTVFEVFGQDSLVVVDAGLLEGVLASFV
ncbi:MAG: Ppx/GppA family phosphatase [Deltaproteobacteria bacterium]|nr:Ppx/GppA family phosphatase [Deltaproteobacteria bacterium]